MGPVIGDDGLTPGEGLASTWRATALAVLALVGAAVIAALIWTQASANRQRDQALALRRHSYEIMILTRLLSGDIARAEASLGRYVISEDRQLGQLYGDEWSSAGAQLDRLDRALAPMGRQRARVAALRQAYDARGRELEVIALSTAYKKNDQALGLFYRASNSPSLARINALLEAITAGERTQLDERTAAAAASVSRVSEIAEALTIFGVMVVLAAVLLGIATVQAQADRAIARADAAAERERAAELEAAVATATGELRVQEAKLRQVQKMEAVGQLTGGIAHDFNNMLAVVLGGLELARRQIDARDPVRRHLDAAVEGAERAAALTRRLLAFSREDALLPEPLGAAQLIAGMRDLLDRTLGDGISVEVVDHGGDWQVLADRVALENAVLNLAVNARDAMEGRGQLTVATGGTTLTAGEVGHCAAGEHVFIAVTDTGTGMEPHVLERAFEPFFTTKPVGKGTGLGLSQIFALVRQLGGEIAIRSTLGEGTAVTLYLPRHRSAETITAVPVVAASLPDPPSDALAILVVEDDPRVLAATIAALEELGHRPIPCSDPLAAPALMDAAGPVDLVLSDVLMPGQTGPEMVAGLAERRPGLAVLFVTGFAGEAGADEIAGRQVLRKPFTLAALDRAVATAVARADAEPLAAE